MWKNGKNCIRMLIIISFILVTIIFMPIKLPAQYPNPAYNSQGYYPYPQINTPTYTQNIYNPYNSNLYNPSQFPFQYNPYDVTPSGLPNQTGFRYNQYIQSPNYYPYEQTTNQYSQQTFNTQNPYAPNPYPSIQYQQNPYTSAPYNQDSYQQNPYNQNPYTLNPYQVSYAPGYYTQNPFTPPPPQSNSISYNQTPINPPPPPPNTFQQAPSFIVTDVSIDETSSGKRINLAEGDTLSIILASTGSRWELEENQQDSDILKKLENNYYPSSTGYAGAGGYEQWIFRGEAIGMTTITLDYTRFLDSSSIENTFEVEIIVY